MTSPDEIRAALAALPAIEACLRACLAAIEPQDVAGLAESQMSSVSTAVGGTASVSTGWAALRSDVVAVSGAIGPLRTVASPADLTRLGLPGTFTNSTWNLASGGPFNGLDVRGVIYYRGSGALTLDNVRCQGVQYAATAGKVGGSFQNVTVVANPRLTLGQGAINFYGQTGWAVDRCDLSGFADGIQCSGPGLVRGTWFHDFAYGPTTHNDGIQNYGGVVTVERSVFELGGSENHTNGALFCSGASASFLASDLWAEAQGTAVNILNAGQSTIIVTGGYLKGGRVVGAVTLVDVERA